MSYYKDEITVAINIALKRELKRELRELSTTELKMQHTNMKLTRKRRHCEDRALAKELGCTIEELIE